MSDQNDSASPKAAPAGTGPETTRAENPPLPEAETFKPLYSAELAELDDFGAIWSVGPSGSVGAIRPSDGHGPGDASLAIPVQKTVVTRAADGKAPFGPVKTPAKKQAGARTPVSYADAGVDIASGDRSKQRIKMLARKTFNKNVLSEIGGFGGLFGLDLEKFPNPVLVSSADGVGTKLKVAFELGIHHTVGQDLVNHCVNDIAVQGAVPLFFLDYLATGALDPAIIETVVTGISEACRANGCALIGGETAQMPGFYADGEYDLAGFIVGAVSRDKIVTGSTIEVGDVLLGLPSNGLHTNGYSLARKLLFEVAGYGPDQYVNELKDKTGAALMRTHRSYLAIIKKLCGAEVVSGMAQMPARMRSSGSPPIYAFSPQIQETPSIRCTSFRRRRVPTSTKWIQKGARSGRITCTTS